MRRYESIDHTADTGIIAYGATLEELFENAAFGMFDLTFQLGSVAGDVDRSIIAAGDDREELLVGWLSQLLAIADAEGLAFRAFSVDRLEEGGVQGVAHGGSSDGLELRGPPVKAVTYHDLAVVDVPEGHWARVVFDV